MSALTGTDWGPESGPRQILNDRIGVTGRLREYGKHGNKIWFPGALNLIGVPGYHNKNQNGTTNGAGKDPTPPVRHPTAPKTKTLTMNWVESTPPITRKTKNSTKRTEAISIQFEISRAIYHMRLQKILHNRPVFSLVSTANYLNLSQRKTINHAALPL
jgi:hypothetical protein